LLCSF